MAQYEHLPIYKKALELAVYMETILRGFPRYHKYTLGADMSNSARELLTLVMKANLRKDKTLILTELRDKCEGMKLLIILGKETKAFRNFMQFQEAAALAVEISRQSEGWLKSQYAKRPGGMHNALASEPMITVRPARHVATAIAPACDALQAGMPYVVVGERGYYPSGLKKNGCNRNIQS
jgi:hypothetical protein